MRGRLAGIGSRWLGAAVLLVLAGVVVLRLDSPRGRTAPAEFTGVTMGTTYSVKLGARESVDDLRVRSAVEGALREVNDLMSTYDPESELSRFNRYTGVEPFAFSPATMRVLETARTITERSGGVFDPTVGPLVDAWGFGPDGSTTTPTDRELTALVARVGFDLIQLDDEAGTATKRRPDVTLDLSAIAKGYGVDRVAAALDAEGIENYLVEVGGEVKGRGTRTDGVPWRIGVEAPVRGARAIFEALPLADMAVATSGDYRNYYERDGTTWTHIVDPRTGRPVPFVGRSISVFHPEAMVADAWATALTVLDLDAALRLAEREGIAAFVVVAGPDGFTSHSTPAFAAYRAAVETPVGGDP